MSNLKLIQEEYLTGHIFTIVVVKMFLICHVMHCLAQITCTIGMAHPKVHTKANK